MEPDIISALWIAVIVLLTIFVWRTIAGVVSAADNEALSSLGEAMFAVTG